MNSLLAFKEDFVRSYGREPRLFLAPGRANIIGEHTDYNEGFVLPFAIEQATFVGASPREDRRMHVRSMNMRALGEIDLDQPAAHRSGWLAYVDGMARALERRIGRLRACDVLIASNVPIGAGLSSSAALEIAIGLALAALSDTEIGKRELALAGQEAEHAGLGLRSGIMDQYISVFGRRDHALLLDCRSLDAQHIPLRLDDAEIVICDSQVRHRLASSEYATRRAECEEASSLLKRVSPGVMSLRDVSIESFERWKENLPEILQRRARHVVYENQRVLSAAAAFADGKLDEVGRLMNASHRSLRNDYAVSCTELDALVESAWRISGVLGARMMGGGFGGSTINLIQRDARARFERELPRAYKQATGRDVTLIAVHPSDGAREICSA